jgi:ribonucleoside-diphosphate reductase beta chain
LKNILAFFAISDGLVIDNLATNFLNEVEILEAQYFYGHQTFIEQVHANGYSLLIETYIKNLTEREELFNSMEKNQAVGKKAAWAEKWIEHPSFAHRLVAFACVEGISFASVFSGVFWYRTRNKMPGLGAMNELILRDETFHYEFALNLFKNYLKDEYKLSKDELRNIILSCYEAEKVFVDESMPEGLQGLTKQDMVKYVQYVTDIVLNDFGCETEFKVRNPLEYMSRIGLSSKNNFFEKREGEYTRVEIPTTIEGMFNEDF